jgi:hypothetical protein
MHFWLMEWTDEFNTDIIYFMLGLLTAASIYALFGLYMGGF